MCSTRYSGHISMNLEFSRQMFGYSSYTKFNETPSSGNRVIPCGQTGMTELIVAFLNFANASQTNLALFPHRGGPCNL